MYLDPFLAFVFYEVIFRVRANDPDLLKGA